MVVGGRGSRRKERASKEGLAGKRLTLLGEVAGVGWLAVRLAGVAELGWERPPPVLAGRRTVRNQPAHAAHGPPPTTRHPPPNADDVSACGRLSFRALPLHGPTHAGWAGGATTRSSAFESSLHSRSGTSSCIVCRLENNVPSHSSPGYKWEIGRASSFAFGAPAYRIVSRDLPRRISSSHLPACSTAVVSLYEIFRPYDLGSFASHSLSDHRPLRCESFLVCLVRDDFTIYSCDCRRWDGYCKAEGTGMTGGVATVAVCSLPCSRL